MGSASFKHLLKHVAKRLGVDQSTLYRWRLQGLLREGTHFVKKGRRLRYDGDRIEDDYNNGRLHHGNQHGEDDRITSDN